jgi:AcrR family transcriptional regulator
MYAGTVSRDPIATRAALVQAAVDGLVEVGYVRTTGVEVCRRAGVTRGALNHHFADHGELLVAVLEAIYAQLLERRGDEPVSVRTWLDVAHARTARPELKAVIELWLASRNDPELGARLGEAIGRLATVFRPGDAVAAGGPEVGSFLRLATEALLGLALGRAVAGGPLGHEDAVVDHLRRLADELDEETR